MSWCWINTTNPLNKPIVITHQVIWFLTIQKKIPRISWFRQWFEVLFHHGKMCAPITPFSGTLVSLTRNSKSQNSYPWTYPSAAIANELVLNQYNQPVEKTHRHNSPSYWLSHHSKKIPRISWFRRWFEVLFHHGKMCAPITPFSRTLVSLTIKSKSQNSFPWTYTSSAIANEMVLNQYNQPVE
jgi:hypothetical protein